MPFIPSTYLILVKFAFLLYLLYGKLFYVSESSHMLLFLPRTYFPWFPPWKLWISQSNSPCYNFSLYPFSLLNRSQFIIIYLFTDQVIVWPFCRWELHVSGTMSILFTTVLSVCHSARHIVQLSKHCQICTVEPFWIIN